MGRHEYEREKRENRPVIAICYDFDKTLSPEDMQAQGFIQAIGFPNPEEFWKKSNERVDENGMEPNLAYMYAMLDEAEGKEVFSKKMLNTYGAKVKLYSGVETWFERINKYAEDHGVIVEHYIISSGLKEMVEGTSIAKYFKRIYACSFYFNERGVAKWPAQVVNYTNKTQFLFRIEKGVLDPNDGGVNEAMRPENVRIPFRNMVYIGDSDTDVPCMRLVNYNGGYSIGVYDPDKKDKTKVFKMIRDGRIKFYAPADYTEGSKIEELVKTIIDRTVSSEQLENRFAECRQESDEYYSSSTKEEILKRSLINALEESASYAETHRLIAELSECSNWTPEEAEALFAAGINNSQVESIITDEDVRAFYEGILRQTGSESPEAEKIRALLK